MNRIIFLLLALCPGASAQVIDIPDPVFRAKLIAQNIDWNSNGQIELSEVQNRTVLDVSNSYTSGPQITNLSGIEYFTALEELYLKYNSLTELDVSMLANLKILDAKNNHLTEINVNGLASLESLNLWNNSLAAVELNSNTALKTLSVGRNDLTSLDLSALTALEYLDCSYSQQSEIDFSNNLNLRSVSAAGNFLTAPNVNFLQNLEFLILSDNPLTTVDMNGMLALYEADFSGSSIETIDLTQTGVSRIVCNNCSELQNVLAKNNVAAVLDGDMLYFGFQMWDCPNLEFICYDESDFPALEQLLFDYPDLSISNTSCELSVRESQNAVAISIVPNPVRDQIHIFSTVEFTEIRIYDLTAKLLIQTTQKHIAEQMIPTLSAGVYVAQFGAGTERSVQKFIKL